MAHKKAGSASSNGRDSAGRRLGVKKGGGMGKDHTLFAKIAGIVTFKKGNGDRKTVHVVPDEEAK